MTTKTDAKSEPVGDFILKHPQFEALPVDWDGGTLPSLIDGLFAAGINAVTAVRPSDATALAAQTLDCLMTQSSLLNQWDASFLVTRPLVVVDRQRAGAWRSSFGEDVTILKARAIACWEGLADAVTSVGADLLIVDSAMMLLGSPAPDGFLVDGWLRDTAVPVIATYQSFQTGPGVKTQNTAPEYADATVWVKYDERTGLTIVQPDQTKVTIECGLAMPDRSSLSISSEQVAQLAIVAARLTKTEVLPQTAFNLVKFAPSEVEAIVGQRSVEEIQRALEVHADRFSDEPPF
ncbi:hypothetical protein M6D93_04155 [Jatrophihabitans telluris]|uniref:Uncharacterized protein n=1 Tax=Jatrophihabitans telluris TaxID=2038343 RepID=A0ABY4R1L8_9ACTN|nr:hypothetical protein [Jatrophihabitans telluris]UQX89202.1 hypothetical protein M6D93_04155 [Jatrophihabitans telluris]